MWSVHYFNAKIAAVIEAWPIGIYADFLRLLRLKEIRNV